ncbi:921_t:CDS:2 [Funneliformis mosseae]|uniref:921_t:CDS:1 n=1 Tax=Funneliformis mosseae TaxID=27381 RepID=A0A9N9C6B2_FUNMO|nr:921_t:CDS:2 [Funneliformis mosseae]
MTASEFLSVFNKFFILNVSPNSSPKSDKKFPGSHSEDLNLKFRPSRKRFLI